jgi:serine/threonine protein phosphatase PrpC
MLATDGLIDSVRHDVIHESLEQLLDKARSWEQTANLLCAKACAQGDDDVTVICMGPIKTSLLAP